MKKIYSIGLLLLIALLSSCRNSERFSRKELIYSYIHNCRDKWKFKEIEKPMKLKVLLHEPRYGICMQVIPGVLIGLDSSNRIVSVLDRSFQDTVYKQNEFVIVYAQEWTETEKKYPLIQAIIHKNDFFNRLNCQVVESYYGRKM